ncbi:hypothetical protein C2E23DRAFT_701397, partial [Lenzites betulinus]
ATTKCRECRGRPSTCATCAVRAHLHLPFHWLFHWNGKFFDRRDLADFGYVIYLGHHGSPCAHIPTTSTPVTFTIVHDNGVHSCKLHYCHCAGCPHQMSQLVRADLFPATLERTETAFTCDVLERFHLDFDISKRSVQDFVRILEQLSPPDQDSGRVKDRYRDFLLASRIHRFLISEKRAGRRHGIVIPGRDPDDLSVPCFTCPIPHFNLPEDWKDIPEELRYIHRMIFCGDGNYSLQKKTKPSDENDIALTTGRAYFVRETDEMRDFLNHKFHVKPAKETSNIGDVGVTCTGFKIPRAQRTGKFRYVDSSGVMSFLCDHVLFRPGATIDLHTTETWGQNDYAFAGALQGTSEL